MAKTAGMPTSKDKTQHRVHYEHEQVPYEHAVAVLEHPAEEPGQQEYHCRDMHRCVQHDGGGEASMHEEAHLLVDGDDELIRVYSYVKVRLIRPATCSEIDSERTDAGCRCDVLKVPVP